MPTFLKDKVIIYRKYLLIEIWSFNRFVKLNFIIQKRLKKGNIGTYAKLKKKIRCETSCLFLKDIYRNGIYEPQKYKVYLYNYVQLYCY